MEILRNPYCDIMEHADKITPLPTTLHHTQPTTLKSADEIGLHDFDEILQLVETLPGPILIHSEIGQVAAIMVFSMVAKQNARKGSEVAEWARELGFDFEGLGRLTQAICAWVDK
ncbi:hypothetical protein BGZ50_009612 [Haplosporangium sp. Z 11]|nr:hypothetical protein BGZ50_009612 [Haplosporangium sp. Z 11]